MASTSGPYFYTAAANGPSAFMTAMNVADKETIETMLEELRMMMCGGMVHDKRILLQRALDCDFILPLRSMVSPMSTLTSLCLRAHMTCQAGARLPVIRRRPHENNSHTS